jgi:hypothetical protein
VVFTWNIPPIPQPSVTAESWITSISSHFLISAMLAQKLL